MALLFLKIYFMYKKIIGVVLVVLVLGGATWYLLIHTKQKETVQAPGSGTVKPPVPAETQSTTTPIVPAKNLEELQARLADKSVLDLYIVRSAKGSFAAAVLSDFRNTKNLVAKQDAYRMYAEGALKANDEHDPAIFLINCAEMLVKPFMDEEYSPGYITLTMYTTDTDLNKTNQIYISPEQDENDFQDKWPVLYGPYRVSAVEAQNSFADLECVKL